MPLRAVLLWFTLLASISIASDSLGLCGGSTIEGDVRRADIIFAGTVRRAELTHSTWSGLVGGKPIPNSTRFVFESVRYAKGTGSPDSIAVIQMGGGTVMVIETVSFRVGARYIVLAMRGPDDHPGTWSAIVCGAGHPFGIWPDSGDAEPVVRDADGRPFLGFDHQHAVVLDLNPWSTDLTPRRGLDGPPQAPARRPFAEVLADLDSLGGFAGSPSNGTPSKPRNPGEGIRWALLYPHQDTGERVSEEEMLRALSHIASEVD